LVSSAQVLTEEGLGHGLVDARASVLSLGDNSYPSSASDGLSAVNDLDPDVLMMQFHLLAITASILVARRPYQQIEEIRGTLGLTDEQYAQIASYRFG